MKRNSEEVFAPARRINQALTASIEKRVLHWMAERAPKWLTSDQLTALGLSAQVGAGVFYAVSRYHRYALRLNRSYAAMTSTELEIVPRRALRSERRTFGEACWKWPGFNRLDLRNL